MSLTRTITLNNGAAIPRLGLGTSSSPPHEIKSAVKYAIDAGYRHIDCAYMYQNESGVGEGIREKITEGAINREDIFVTSKLWNTFHRADLVRGALISQLRSLQLDYLDLYLIHWPMALKEGDVLLPRDADGRDLASDADWLDTWKEFEKLHDEGLVKAIGVSNFNKKQLTRLLNNARVKPVINQIECHPHLQQKSLSAFCKEHDIVVTAYCPLGAPQRERAKPEDLNLLTEPLIQQIASKHNKGTAQVLIRYQLQRGHVAIPKSVTQSRIISNFNVWDFELSPEDIATIETFESNGRLVPMSTSNLHPEYPFNEEYFVENPPQNSLHRN